MTPTPTPIPYSPQLDKGLDLLSEALQRGLVGIIFMIIVVGLAIVIVIGLYLYLNRNKKDNSSTINEALLTFGRMYEESQKQAREDKEWQRRVDMRRDIQIKRMNGRQIESLLAMSDSNNHLADTLNGYNQTLSAINIHNHMQTANTEAMRLDLNSMREVGSIPLQNAILMINSIKEQVTNIALRQTEDRVSLSRALELLTGANDTLLRIENRRKTGEFPAVPPN